MFLAYDLHLLFISYNLNMTQESIHTNPDISEVLRMTIGQEADYYIRQMHELEPAKFAVIKVGGETVQNDIESLASDIAMQKS